MIRVSAVVAVAILGLGGSSASACQVCQDFSVRIFGLPIGPVRQACLPADVDAEGYTECSLLSVGESSICLMGGTFCTVINAGSGG